MTNLWRDPPTLAGRYVRLRRLVPEDRDALVAAAGDQTALFHTNVASFIDPDAAMAAIFRERDVGRAMPFAVETLDAQVVGLTR